MKKINIRQRKNGWRVIRKENGKSSIATRLMPKMRRQRATCLKRGREIFKKLKAVEVSIEIIAREIARRVRAIGDTHLR